jgi:membrane-associated protease RseP (regulator of RpoE activity)
MKTKLVHAGLFFLTFLTTMQAGMFWTTGSMGPYELKYAAAGLPYSLSLLFILACHEFGHYFAAMYHKVSATLPFFIPMPMIGGFLNFGTMGAVIKTKSAVHTNKAMFDIGAAGPIAGFIASLILIIYGFVTLPGPEYILKIHPDFFMPHKLNQGAVELKFGDTILFAALRSLLTHPGQFVPPMSEIYHYPYLCVGWFGLFITAMNLVPVGQLDGGHVIYSMFGEKVHDYCSKIFLGLLALIGMLGFLNLFMDFEYCWPGWLLWALVLFFILKSSHPAVFYFGRLGKVRMALGYFCIFIFIVSFSPAPFFATGN